MSHLLNPKWLICSKITNCTSTVAVQFGMDQSVNCSQDKLCKSFGIQLNSTASLMRHIIISSLFKQNLIIKFVHFQLWKSNSCFYFFFFDNSGVQDLLDQSWRRQMVFPLVHLPDKFEAQLIHIQRSTSRIFIPSGIQILILLLFPLNALLLHLAPWGPNSFFFFFFDNLVFKLHSTNLEVDDLPPDSPTR